MTHLGPYRQRGISLIVILLLLLVMTLIGLAVLRTTLLQERMSANLRDRSLSFQAAEAALRDAEEFINREC
jgi:type IV pilus assembly protein PilX